MHKFNEKSLTIDLINNLLYNYWLPIYDSVLPGDYIVKNYYYVFLTNIIKCTKSGIIRGLLSQDETRGTFLIVWPYTLGNRYRKFTDNYIPNSSNYIIDTHIRLGKFVHVYSDLTGVNLKPYYNCNCNKQIDNLYINKSVDSTLGTIFLLYDARTKYKVFTVPIRFNRTYTISIDSPGEVLMCPIFRSHERKLVLNNPTAARKEDKELDISKLFLKDSNQYFNFTSMSFSKPEYILVDCKDELADKYYKYQNNLYLLILVSEDNDSSIVVLEGKYDINYTQLDSEYSDYKDDDLIIFKDKVRGLHIINLEKLYSLDEFKLNSILLPNPSLLLYNIKELIPFSNRLVEYLFDNVIDYTWKLDSNIQRAQNLLTNVNTNELHPGIWDLNTRLKMYLFALEKKKSRHLDLSGNVDREVERLLLKSPFNREDLF